MTTPAPADVIIVGAGPTGVAAATLLAQHGIRCVVLDRYRTVYPQPRAVHLDDEVYRIIAQLGVAEQFAAISRPAHGLRLLGADHSVLAEIKRDPSRSTNGYPQANMFDQPSLEAVLRDNLATCPAATLLGGVEVTSVQDGQSGAQVTFTDRDSGTDHALQARYVLGCDGANSVVRAAIGSAMNDMRFQQRWLVIDIATEANLHRWEGVEQVCDPQRAATYMRIGPQRYRWEFQLLPGETAATYGNIAALRPLLAPWVGDLSGERLQLLRVAEYTFRAQVADHWRRGNVFLLGDAAHLTPPFIGQGMGAGLRDAANLSWKLAAVLHGEMTADILETYEVERKSHARTMIRMALAIGWAMTAGGPGMAALRGSVVSRLARLPLVTGLLAENRSPRLRRGPLVDKPRRWGGLAGWMCPNPVLPDGRRLDAVLGAGFGLMTTENLGRALRDRLAARGVSVVTVQAGDELARWLKSGHCSAALVRPDRTVWRTGSAENIVEPLLIGHKDDAHSY